MESTLEGTVWSLHWKGLCGVYTRNYVESTLGTMWSLHWKGLCGVYTGRVSVDFTLGAKWILHWKELYARQYNRAVHG